MAHPYKSQCSDDRKLATTRYKAEGGTVVRIPFREGGTQAAIERLTRAGDIGTKGSQGHERAMDFLSSQAKAKGFDPVAMTGREPKYKKGGRT